jgi:uncharacterized protein (TIGR02217 family)
VAFHNERFPELISQEASGGPGFSTSISQSISGFEGRNRNWYIPLHEYNVSHGIKNQEDFEDVRAFFYNVYGQADGFRYKDWADYSCTQLNSALLNITGTTWQMYRTYTSGSRVFYRKVTRPCASPVPAIWRTSDGSPTVVSLVTPSSINYETGVVTITDHTAGDTYSWVGEFDVPVRFADDSAEWALLGVDVMYESWPDIILVEIREGTTAPLPVVTHASGFLDLRLNEFITQNARGGPMFSTSVTKTSSGHEIRARNWDYPLHTYNVGHGIKTPEDFEEVRAAFYNVYGQADAFRFKDWADFTATELNSVLVFVSGSTWQLNRKYTFGTRTFQRKVTRPCTSPAVVVRRTRASVVTTAGATVNYSTGTVVISGHVAGDTYTWIGQFDLPARFALDKADWSALLVHRAYASWPDIPIVEIRE